MTSDASTLKNGDMDENDDIQLLLAANQMSVKRVLKRSFQPDAKRNAVRPKKKLR